MKKTGSIILLAVMIISCCGCDVYVSGEDYRILQRDFETQIALNKTMKDEMRTMREELIVVRRELEAAKRELAAARHAPPPLPLEDAEGASSQAENAPDALPPILPPDETPAAAASAGTSSISSFTSSAAASSSSETSSGSGTPSSVSSETSSASSAPLPDEKAQSKFKDIANTLG